MAILSTEINVIIVVAHLDPQTLVVVDCPPSPAREHRHGPCPLRALETSREPVDRSVRTSVSCRLNYRPDRPPEGMVRASAIAINVTSESVDWAVPTGAVGPVTDTGTTLPLRRQRTSRGELPTNEVIMLSPAEGVAGGVASPADLAGVVAAGVASYAELAGDATVSVVSPADAGVRLRPTLLGWCPRPILLRWRPLPLLRWRLRPNFLGWRPWPTLLGWCP